MIIKQSKILKEKKLSVKKLILTISLLFVVLIVSIWVCVHLGPERIPPGEINGVLLSRLQFRPMIESTIHTIIWEIRLPRVLLAALVGAALSVSGAAFQGILRNPLADPYIVGTSAGAAVGGVFAIVFNIRANFLGISAVALLAFAGSLLAMYLVYRIARVNGRIPVETFLLAGVVIGSFLWAFVSFMLTLASKNLHEVVFWLMGSTQSADWSGVLMLLVYFIIGFTGLMFLAHPLNLMTLGDRSAQHLGVEVEKIKNLTIIFASLATAASVSAAGLIGFVGLMIPHIMRMILGADHRILTPASAMGGALFLVWVDTAARTMIAPREIPVGILTAILGAPFFLYLLRKQRKETG